MKKNESKQPEAPKAQVSFEAALGEMKPRELTRIARIALEMLHFRAIQGSDSALDALWQAGMFSAERLEQMTLDDECGEGERVRKLAGKKLSWPFKLHAISEFRSTPNGLSNPEEFARQIGLGRDTGIKLKNPGKARELTKPGTPASLALRVRRQIEADLKRYGDQEDAEILSGRYHTWKRGKSAATGKLLQANRKKFLEYVKAIRAINDLSDQTQWMNAADLWLFVAFEGNPDDRPLSSKWARGRWPKKVYERAEKNGRSVRAVLSQNLLEGFKVMIAPPSAKKRLR